MKKLFILLITILFSNLILAQNRFITGPKNLLQLKPELTGKFNINALTKTFNYKSQRSSVIEILDSTVDFSFDTTLLIWNKGSRSIYTYDANNNMLTWLTQVLIGNTWLNDALRTYTYDANHNMLTLLYQPWTNGAWENYSLFTYTYDSNNNNLTYLVQTWSGTVWVNEFYAVSTYDINNNLMSTMSYSWNNGIWVNEYLYDYTYDSNNNILTQLEKEWVNNAWQDYYLFTWTYDANNNELSWLLQSWNGSTWENNNYHTYTNDANNNQLTDLLYTWTNNAWRKYDIHISTFDSLNYRQTFIIQNWNGSSFVNYDSTQYYYHQALTGLVSDYGDQHISVFPNPADKYTTISYPFSTGENYFLKILDITGKEVFQSAGDSLHPEFTSETIDVSRFENGIYFIKLQSKNKNAIRKIIVQH